jgi:hypothetical protein
MLKLSPVILSQFSRTMSAAASSRFTVQGPYNWINNARVEPIDKLGNIQDLEPRSGKLLANVTSSGKEEVNRAVQAAKIAFKSWSQVIM